MKKIQKHEFEAVSLLTVENGLLELTVVPAIGQPDWLLPSRLVLSVNAFSEHIWTYLWQDPANDNHTQEVMVYQLLPKSETPDKIVVVEGNTDVHRIGLLTRGELKELQVRISDVKDIEQPANDAHGKPTDEAPTKKNMDDEIERKASEEYVYQFVEINGTRYAVPDIDTLAHHLVDLDS